VLGLGSVFWGPYMSLIEKLHAAGKVHVAAVYDPDPEKRRAAATRLDLDASLSEPDDVIEHADVDLVLVLTSMNEHGVLARKALEAGRHVLVEKPLATSLEEAAALVELASTAPGHLLPAPHILLSPTYRAIHARVQAGDIGRIVSARARYGWSGPDWAAWFYEPGGGALFDLGVYNVVSLCGLFGPARRVTAMTGVAIPTRRIGDQTVTVEAEDNAHVVIDFGEGRLAVVTTGFTMQKYRSPAIELYGTGGVAQLLGDDWAPEGYELWRNGHGAWEVFAETDPSWPWTDGLRHLVECIAEHRAPLIRPEHGFHALEIMLAAQAAGADGRARDIASGFPAPDYAALPADTEDHRRVHDPRSLL
jgi:predicted dehydrogenase